MPRPPDPAHADEELRLLREDDGMTIDEVAARRYWDRIAGVRAEIERHYQRGRPAPADPDRQLEELCRVLNFGVGHVVFGSHVARLNGVAVETVDVDLVPDRERENLDRLAEALNFVRARWRIKGRPRG